MRIRSLIIAALFLFSAGLMLAVQNGNDLYQQGLARETAGDIAGAVQIFERIVRDFSANRPLAARALVQLGTWYELLGKDQARNYYERVVREYGDQDAMVTEAKKRLTVKTNAPIEIATPFTNDPWSFALSPDGRSLVFVATVDGKTSLWLRQLDSGKQAPIAGTEGHGYGTPTSGANPFWSLDGRFIGYFEDGKLKRIPAGGGTPMVLANAPANAGGAWNATGDIVFAPEIFNSPLYRVSADGGPVVAVTRLEPPSNAHRYPRFLPDGRFLFYSGDYGSTNTTFIGSLNSVESMKLPLGPNNGVAFAPPDRLLLVSGGAVSFQGLNLQKNELTGSSSRLIEQVASFGYGSGYAAFSVSASGSVAYRPSVTLRRRLIWRDRMGREIGPLIPAALDLAGIPQFSPDGRSVIVSENSVLAPHGLLVNIDDGQFRILAPGGFGVTGPSSPIWSPNGDFLAFSALSLNAGGGVFDLFQIPISGDRTQGRALLRTQETKIPVDWNGTFLLFNRSSRTNGSDLMVMSTQGTEDPIPVAATPAQERNGRFSPDGHWIAYDSDEVGGQPEIFVQAFPGSTSVRRKVSVNGGNMAQWRRDGRELYFLSPDNHVMAVPVTISADGTDIEIGKPAPLFQDPLPLGSTFAPSPDGRFLVSQPVEAAPPIFVLRNAVNK